MSAIIHYDWINRNSLRSFPIQENADVAGELPCDIIADMRLLLFNGNVNESVFILSVFVSTSIVTVVIGTSTQALGSVTFKKNAGLSTSQIKPMISGVTGSISCGTAFLNEVDIFPLANGLYNFGTKLPVETRCVTLIKDWLPVKSIKSFGGSAISGSGVEIQTFGSITSESEKYVDSSGLNATRITLSIKPGDLHNYISTCLKKAIAEAKCAKPIYKINSVSPNSDGTIFIEFIGFQDHIIVPPTTVTLTVVGNLNEVCVRPVMPNDQGLLPEEI